MILLAKGRCLWDFKVSGQAVVIDDNCFPPVEACKNKIIITHIPSPDIVVYMREVKAVVAETGGVLCHAAVLALELGCPIIVAAENATKNIISGNIITLIGNDGVGEIYD